MTTPSSLFLSHWLTQEDTALLAAADSLDEAGDVDRAEMIRAELELERHRLTTAEAKRYATVGPISEYRDWESLRSRLAALKAAHVGPCERCRGTTLKDSCLLCIDRSRWDRLMCGHCSGRGVKVRIRGGPEEYDCLVCRGSGDLFERRNFMEERIGLRERGSFAHRSLHFHRGLILVSATLEEAVEEVLVRCPTCDGKRMVRRSMKTETLCRDCDTGTILVQRPSSWSAALLGARRDVGIFLEGKETISHGRFPNNGYIWCRGEPSNDPGIGWFIPAWLFDLLEGGRLDPPEEAGQAPAMVYSSPESAKLQLSIAISRHLHSQIGV